MIRIAIGAEAFDAVAKALVPSFRLFSISCVAYDLFYWYELLTLTIFFSVPLLVLIFRDEALVKENLLNIVLFLLSY